MPAWVEVKAKEFANLNALRKAFEQYPKNLPLEALYEGIIWPFERNNVDPYDFFVGNAYATISFVDLTL